MVRLLKGLCALIVFILAFAIIAATCIFLIDSRVYSNYLKQQTITFARSHGIQLSIGEAEFWPTHFHLVEVEVRAPRFPPIEFDVLSGEISYGGLLNGLLTLDLSGRLYHGSVQSRIELYRSGTIIPRRVLIEGVKLSRHPQLQMLGIEGGRLDAHFPEFRGTEPHTIMGRGTIKVNNLGKPTPLTLPPFLTGLPLALTIPAFKELSLTLTQDLTETSLNSSATLASSFGDCSSTSRIGRDDRAKGVLLTVDSFSADSACTLTSQGQEFIGPFLPLVSRGKVQSSASSFSFSYSTLKKPPLLEWQAAR